MRDLNECRVEVFRRSKIRIKERKKIRNRILILCIPLCLVITACSVIFLPQINTKNVDGDMRESSENSLDIITNFVSIEVVSQHQYSENSVITDPSKIKSIHNTILELFKSNPQDFADEDVQDKVYSYKSESSSLQEEFSIIFTTNSGRIIEYSLVGNELYDINNDLRIYLSIDKLSEIKETLGLTE